MPKLNIRNFKYHLELEGWNLKLQHVLKFYAFIPYFANGYLLLLVLRVNNLSTRSKQINLEKLNCLESLIILFTHFKQKYFLSS
jgi:hypothetical protein